MHGWSWMIRSVVWQIVLPGPQMSSPQTLMGCPIGRDVAARCAAAASKTARLAARTNVMHLRHLPIRLPLPAGDPTHQTPNTYVPYMIDMYSAPYIAINCMHYCAVHNRYMVYKICL